jgi:predicted secreted protein
MNTTSIRCRIIMIFSTLMVTICCAMLLVVSHHHALSAGAKRATLKSATEVIEITIYTPLATTKAIQVQVVSGDSFTITLPSNITTGYSWRLAGKLASKTLKNTDSHYVAPSMTIPGKDLLSSYLSRRGNFSGRC